VTGLGAAAGWWLAVSMATALGILVLRDGRRRHALNEALHELRRPLQALALAGGVSARPKDDRLEGSVRLAAAALDRLDSAVNGGPGHPGLERFRCEPVLRSAVGRWRPRVAVDGGSLELRWRAGEATVEGERERLEAAIDNLIVNSIEHGSCPIVVEGRRRGDRLYVSVADAGCGRSPEADRGRIRSHGLLFRAGGLAGPRRHGHGLAVVRRVALDHGGRFVLRRAPAGSTAVLELPLAADPVGRACA
jgi:signal transduction histidine kinase